MTWAAVAVGGATVGSTLISTYGKKNKVEEPKEITAARQQLLDFSRTGKYGDFQAGAEVPLGYGDYKATDLEKQGLSKVQGLLTNGIPQQFKMGDQALQEMLGQGTGGIDAQFQPFKDITNREINLAERGAKRSSAFTGSLYSTDTVRKLGDVRARGVETMSQKLSDLTNQALDRKMQAIPLAYQAGESEANFNQNAIQNAMNYGGLTRQLNDASIKSRDAELLRRRQELQMPIEAAKSVLGGPSQTPIEQSPYQALLGTVGQLGGQYLGNQMFMSQYARKFPTGGPTAGAPAAPNYAGTYAGNYSDRA